MAALDGRMLLLVFILSLALLLPVPITTQTTSPPPFAHFAIWLDNCTSLPNAGSACQPVFSTLVQAATWVPSADQARFQPAVTAGQLSQACSASTCRSQLTTSLTTLLSSTDDQASCSPFGNSSRMASFLAAAQVFTCASTNAAGGSGTASGACVSILPQLLTAAGLSPSLSTLMRPSLTFSGASLSSICATLLPAAGCCFRTWALLMSALARQLCFTSLANEYLALPGRCEVLLPNSSVPGYCIADWATTLQPLLVPAQPGCTAAAQSQSQAWVDGSACSTAQQQKQSCPGDACSLWCGYLGSYAAALAGTPEAAPGPAPVPNAPPPPAAAAPTEQGFSPVVKTFIIAFSVIVLVCLLLFLAWVLWLYCARRRRHRARATAAASGGGDATIEEPATPTYGTTGGSGLQGVSVMPGASHGGAGQIPPDPAKGAGAGTDAGAGGVITPRVTAAGGHEGGLSSGAAAQQTRGLALGGSVELSSMACAPTVDAALPVAPGDVLPEGEAAGVALALAGAGALVGRDAAAGLSANRAGDRGKAGQASAGQGDGHAEGAAKPGLVEASANQTAVLGAAAGGQGAGGIRVGVMETNAEGSSSAAATTAELLAAVVASGAEPGQGAQPATALVPPSDESAAAAVAAYGEAVRAAEAAAVAAESAHEHARAAREAAEHSAAAMAGRPRVVQGQEPGPPATAEEAAREAAMRAQEAAGVAQRAAGVAASRAEEAGVAAEAAEEAAEEARQALLDVTADPAELPGGAVAGAAVGAGTSAGRNLTGREPGSAEAGVESAAAFAAAGRVQEARFEAEQAKDGAVAAAHEADQAAERAEGEARVAEAALDVVLHPYGGASGSEAAIGMFSARSIKGNAGHAADTVDAEGTSSGASLAMVGTARGTQGAVAVPPASGQNDGLGEATARAIVGLLPAAAVSGSGAETAAGAAAAARDEAKRAAEAAGAAERSAQRDAREARQAAELSVRWAAETTGPEGAAAAAEAAARAQGAETAAGAAQKAAAKAQNSATQADAAAATVAAAARAARPALHADQKLGVLDTPGAGAKNAAAVAATSVQEAMALLQLVKQGAVAAALEAEQEAGTAAKDARGAQTACRAAEEARRVQAEAQGKGAVVSAEVAREAMNRAARNAREAQEALEEAAGAAEEAERAEMGARRGAEDAEEAMRRALEALGEQAGREAEAAFEAAGRTEQAAAAAEHARARAQRAAEAAAWAASRAEDEERRAQDAAGKAASSACAVVSEEARAAATAVAQAGVQAAAAAGVAAQSARGAATMAAGKAAEAAEAAAAAAAAVAATVEARQYAGYAAQDQAGEAAGARMVSGSAGRGRHSSPRRTGAGAAPGSGRGASGTRIPSMRSPAAHGPNAPGSSASAGGAYAKGSKPAPSSRPWAPAATPLPSTHDGHTYANHPKDWKVPGISPASSPSPPSYLGGSSRIPAARVTLIGGSSGGAATSPFTPPTQPAPSAASLRRGGPRSTGTGASSVSQSSGGSLGRPNWRLPSKYVPQSPPVFLSSPGPPMGAEDMSPSTSVTSPSTVRRPAWKLPSARPNIIGAPVPSLAATVSPPGSIGGAAMTSPRPGSPSRSPRQI